MNVFQYLIHGSHNLRPYGRGAILLPTQERCIQFNRDCERAMTLRILMGLAEANRAALRRTQFKKPA